MAKVYNTTVSLKYGSISHGKITSSFTAPDVYKQAMEKADIHTFVDNNGRNTELFVPKENISNVVFSVTESEAEAPADAYCEV